jgi:hypothetical protein
MRKPLTILVGEEGEGEKMYAARDVYLQKKRPLPKGTWPPLNRHPEASGLAGSVFLTGSPAGR